MPEEACAMVCGLLSAICAILSWHTMKEGDRECMVIVVVFAAIVVLISGCVLVHKFSH